MHRKTNQIPPGYFGFSIRSSKNWAVIIAVCSLFFLGSRADNAYWSNTWPRQSAAQGVEFEYAGVFSHFTGSISLCMATAIAGSIAWTYAHNRDQIVMLVFIWLPWLMASGLAIFVGFGLLLEHL